MGETQPRLKACVQSKYIAHLNVVSIVREHHGYTIESILIPTWLRHSFDDSSRLAPGMCPTGLVPALCSSTAGGERQTSDHAQRMQRQMDAFGSSRDGYSRG